MISHLKVLTLIDISNTVGTSDQMRCRRGDDYGGSSEHAVTNNPRQVALEMVQQDEASLDKLWLRNFANGGNAASWTSRPTFTAL